jgi:hypothetical protein
VNLNPRSTKIRVRADRREAKRVSCDNPTFTLIAKSFFGSFKNHS